MRKRHKYAVAPELTLIVLAVLLSAIFLTIRTAVTQRQQSQSNAENTASQSGKLASGSAQPAINPIKIGSGAATPASGSGKPNPATGSASPASGSAKPGKTNPPPPQSQITPQYYCIGSGSTAICNPVGSSSGNPNLGSKSGSLNPPKNGSGSGAPCPIGSGTTTSAATQNAILATTPTRKKENGLLDKLISSLLPPAQTPVAPNIPNQQAGTIPCPPNTKAPTASGSGTIGTPGKCSQADTDKGYSYCYGDGPNSDRCLPPGGSCDAPSTAYKDGSNKGSYCVDQIHQSYTPAGGTPNIGASGSAQPVSRGVCTVCPLNAQVKDFDPAKSGQATTCQCNDPLILANNGPVCVPKIPNCSDKGHTATGTCTACLGGFIPSADGRTCVAPPPPPPPVVAAGKPAGGGAAAPAAGGKAPAGGAFSGAFVPGGTGAGGNVGTNLPGDQPGGSVTTPPPSDDSGLCWGCAAGGAGAGAIAGGLMLGPVGAVVGGVVGGVWGLFGFPL